MTTMELNLRKQSLNESINRMDEGDFVKIEKYAQRLCKNKQVKKPVTYPWALSGEELTACVREAREDVLYGRCVSDEELSEEMKRW